MRKIYCSFFPLKESDRYSCLHNMSFWKRTYFLCLNSLRLLLQIYLFQNKKVYLRFLVLIQSDSFFIRLTIKLWNIFLLTKNSILLFRLRRNIWSRLSFLCGLWFILKLCFNLSSKLSLPHFFHLKGN